MAEAEKVVQMSLDGILDGEKPQEAVKEAVKEVKTGQKVEKTEKIETKPEKKTEITPDVKSGAEIAPKPDKPEPSANEKAYFAAMQDERRKRQELETKFRELEAKIPKEPEKTFWEAPEDAFTKFKAEIDKEKQALRGEVTNLRLGTAEMLARQRYKDYDEKVSEFGKMLEQTPEAQRPLVIQNWLASPDPAETAYQAAKSNMMLREAGSIDKLLEKKEKEIRLRIETELKEKEEALKKERESIPGTLSDTRGMTQQKTEWGGPPSLDDLLKS